MGKTKEKKLLVLGTPVPRCKHPEEKIQPGKFYERTGSFMTFGPRETEVRHVIDWCSGCGAIRCRERTEDEWGEWQLPGGAT